MKYGEVERGPLYVSDVDVRDRRAELIAKTALTAISGAGTIVLAVRGEASLAAAYGTFTGAIGKSAIDAFSLYKRVVRENQHQHISHQYEMSLRQAEEFSGQQGSSAVQ